MISTLIATCAWGYGPGFFWPIFPLLWFVLIVGLIVFFGRRFRRRAWAGPGRSGESVLAELFARGEIDESEYAKRLAVLKSHTRER
jgi:putative membrane protein